MESPDSDLLKCAGTLTLCDLIIQTEAPQKKIKKQTPGIYTHTLGMALPQIHCNEKNGRLLTHGSYSHTNLHQKRTRKKNIRYFRLHTGA